MAFVSKTAVELNLPHRTLTEFSPVFFSSFFASWNVYMNGKNGTLVLFLPDLTYLVRAVGARAVLIPLILKCHVDRERMGGRIG